MAQTHALDLRNILLPASNCPRAQPRSKQIPSSYGPDIYCPESGWYLLCAWISSARAPNLKRSCCGARLVIRCTQSLIRTDRCQWSSVPFALFSVDIRQRSDNIGDSADRSPPTFFQLLTRPGYRCYVCRCKAKNTGINECFMRI